MWLLTMGCQPKLIITQDENTIQINGSCSGTCEKGADCIVDINVNNPDPAHFHQVRGWSDSNGITYTYQITDNVQGQVGVTVNCKCGNKVDATYDGWFRGEYIESGGEKFFRILLAIVSLGLSVALKSKGVSKVSGIESSLKNIMRGFEKEQPKSRKK